MEGSTGWGNEKRSKTLYFCAKTPSRSFMSLGLGNAVDDVDHPLQAAVDRLLSFERIVPPPSVKEEQGTARSAFSSSVCVEYLSFMAGRWRRLVTTVRPPPPALVANGHRSSLILTLRFRFFIESSFGFSCQFQLHFCPSSTQQEQEFWYTSAIVVCNAS